MSWLSFGGAWYKTVPSSKCVGSSSTCGGLNLNFWPSSNRMVSIVGLNWSDPAKAKVATSSGDVTNECVSGLPSCLPTKFRL